MRADWKLGPTAGLLLVLATAGTGALAVTPASDWKQDSTGCFVWKACTVNDAFKRDLDRVVGQDEAAFVLALGSTDLAHAEEENLCEVRQVRFDAAESSGLAKCNEVAIRELQEIEADCTFGCPPFKVEDFSYKCTAVKDFLAAYNACFPPPAPPPPFVSKLEKKDSGALRTSASMVVVAILAMILA